jgi:SAM-dependent methyltransferase
VGEHVDNWRSVASGWERQRQLFLTSTGMVSERLVALLDPRPGETILELAAGPGDTGLLAARSLGPGGRLVSTDFAPEMVEAARRRAAELGLEEVVTFAVEDMQSLSFADSSFDGAVCRWGLMLVPDMETAAREISRVLRPGGRIALAVWGDAEDNDWMTVPGRSALELGLVERPDPDAPGPFRLAREGALEDLLAGAGLRVETVEDVSVTWRASSLSAWWEIVRDTSRSLALILESATADDAKAIRTGAERRLERYVQPDGSLEVPGRTHVALARRPT